MREGYRKFEDKKTPSLFTQNEKDSDFTKFVKIQAEVERIFLLYSESDNKSLNFNEINAYLDD